MRTLTRFIFALFLTLAAATGRAAHPESDLPQDVRLASAIKARNLDAMRAALQAGARLDAWVRLPGEEYPVEQQQRAIFTDDVAVVELLIEQGADLASGLSRAFCRPELVRAYLRHGVDADAHPPDGQTLLSQVVEGGRSKYRPANTAKEEAQRKNCLVTAKLLIESGASVQGPRGDRGPLETVVTGGDPDFLQLFADAGADFNQGPYLAIFSVYDQLGMVDTGSPVASRNVAEWRWDMRTLKFLLDHGADPNRVNCGPWEEDGDYRYGFYDIGLTPMAVAARYGWYDVVQLLLSKGANPLLAAAGGAQGRVGTPQELARNHGHSRTAALLARAERAWPQQAMPAALPASAPAADVDSGCL